MISPRLVPVLALSLAVGLIIGAAFWRGYVAGNGACEAEHAAQTVKVQEELSGVQRRANDAEADRLAAETALEEAQRRLDDAANLDPDGARCGISLDGVRRLNQ